MAEQKIKAKVNGNGHNTEKEQDEQAIAAAWRAKKDKGEVPHAFNVLFNVEKETELAQVTRLNDREIMFMGVNGVRDDAMIPRGKRPSISTCLRARLMGLKISKDGKGRDDALAVSNLSQEEAMAQSGNAITDVGR